MAPVVVIAVLALIAFALWVVTDPHFKAERRHRRNAGFPKDLWLVPSFEGKQMDFSDVVGTALMTNGRYIKSDHVWVDQKRPRVGDIVIVLYTCSMGVTINKDYRGRVFSVAYSSGWHQDAVDITVIGQGFEHAQSLKFALSDVIPFPALKHHWIVVQ